jgi:hypothetical protein
MLCRQANAREKHPRESGPFKASLSAGIKQEQGDQGTGGEGVCWPWVLHCACFVVERRSHALGYWESTFVLPSLLRREVEVNAIR